MIFTIYWSCGHGDQPSPYTVGFFYSLLMVVTFQLIREFFVPADNCGDDQAMFYCMHVNVKITLTRRLGGKDCKTELWIVNSNTWFCLNA